MIGNLSNKQYSLVLMVVIFLSSCSMGNKYQQPPLELPKQFGTVSFADTSSIADIEWKHFFTDTTLQGLIEKGLNNNHDLLIAVKRIDIANQELKQSKYLQMPEVNLQLTGQISRPSDNSLNGISLNSFLGKSYLENYSAAVNLSWKQIYGER